MQIPKCDVWSSGGSPISLAVHNFAFIYNLAINVFVYFQSETPDQNEINDNI